MTRCFFCFSPASTVGRVYGAEELFDNVWLFGFGLVTADGTGTKLATLEAELEAAGMLESGVLVVTKE